MNPPSIVFFGGGVHGKVCWLIAYKSRLMQTKLHSRLHLSIFCTSIIMYSFLYIKLHLSSAKATGNLQDGLLNVTTAYKVSKSATLSGCCN